MIRVGLIQFAAVDDEAANISKAQELVRTAAATGAQIVCLQELFNTIYFPVHPPEERFFDLAESIDGPAITQMRALAHELRIMLLAPIYEELAVGRLFNSAALIGLDGEIIHVWRKIHIPRVRVPGNGWTEIDEKLYFEPGPTAHAVCETAFGRIGVLICHDRHFPESARCLALSGAEVVFVPSASRGIPEVRDPGDAWAVELRGLAIQNMYFLCGVNRVGVEAGESFFGQSLVAGPDGAIVAMAGREEEVLLVDVDVEKVRRTRIARGFLRDRRPDTYSTLTQSPDSPITHEVR